MNNYEDTQHQPTGSNFFDSLRNTGWYRAEPAVLGGVCAGISYKTGWDRNLVRFIFILLTLFLGGGLFLYGLAWLLLPHGRDGSIVLEQAVKGDLTGELFLSVLMIFIGLTSFTNSIFNHHGMESNLFLLPIALVAMVLFFIFRNNSANHQQLPKQGGSMPNDKQPKTIYVPPQPSFTPPTRVFNEPKPNRPAPSKKFFLITFAVMLLAIPVTYMLYALGGFIVSDRPYFTYTISFGLAILGLSSIVLALALLINAIRGRRTSWFTGIGIVMILSLVSAIPIGAMIYRTEPIWSEYGVEVGNRQIDLVDDISKGNPLDYSFGVGNLHVLLPENVPTTVEINLSSGKIDLSGLKNYRVVQRTATMSEFKEGDEFSGMQLHLFISNTQDWRDADVQATIDMGISDVSLTEIHDDSIKDLPQFKEPAAKTTTPDTNSKSTKKSKSNSR